MPLSSSIAKIPPDGDGWIPWPEDDTGKLRQPLDQLGDLVDGWAIESRYDYDGEWLIRAWSRAIPAEDQRPASPKKATGG